MKSLTYFVVFCKDIKLVILVEWKVNALLSILLRFSLSYNALYHIHIFLCSNLTGEVVHHELTTILAHIHSHLTIVVLNSHRSEKAKVLRIITFHHNISLIFYVWISSDLSHTRHNANKFGSVLV